MIGSTVTIVLASLFSSAALAISNCSQVEQVEITFYGFPDNSPPGSGIECGITSTGTCDPTCLDANNSLTQIGSLFNYTTSPTSSCGPRGEKAGGSGTYDDPLTMASSGKWFCHLEVVYLPYLQKYLRYEDFCQQCIDDANAGKSVHIDIWTGSNATNGGQVQLQCENSLTPGYQVPMMRNPPPDLPVDKSELFIPNGSGKGICNNTAVYSTTSVATTLQPTPSSAQYFSNLPPAHHPPPPPPSDE